MVLRVPILPFARPPNARARRAQSSVLEKPKRMLDVMVQIKATRMVGFRPYRSDARPHQIPVRLWDNEKMADVVPAHWATLSVGTLNDSIISGRYGKTEVKAIGSANRHIATLISDCDFSPTVHSQDLLLTENEELLLRQLWLCSSHDSCTEYYQLIERG